MCNFSVADLPSFTENFPFPVCRCWDCKSDTASGYNLKFLYKLRKSAGESHAMLKQVFGDKTVTLKTVYAWFKKFTDGRESVEDENRSGRPHLKQPISRFLLQDNLRPHTATLVKWLMAQQGITELSQPPYSPELSPPDFFLFPKLKTALKGRRFTEITHI
ncbi:hypothetical protein AVEN_225264-1 [Araneus ventricosus]|uniref:Mos1 transposase HTH domain-containing protein n=1 Tax=Araneus ventricosus TaxID=182803 RepID=A0A4Y2ANJ6_ARAVE|nr:hypothetical protein AVEN_225264-1 [Araneus ventricosus]